MNGLFRRVLLLGATLLALPPWTASAQDVQQNDRPPEARQRQQQQRRLATLAQRLNLSADQKKQWAQINRETTQKIWAARRDESLNEGQMQAQLRKIHKEQKEQIMALLTPQQQDELKSFWEEQKQKQQEKSADGSGNSGSGAAQSSGSSQDDDLFAGMVSDDPPAQPAQNKKPGQK